MAVRAVPRWKLSRIQQIKFFVKWNIRAQQTEGCFTFHKRAQRKHFLTCSFKHAGSIRHCYRNCWFDRGLIKSQEFKQTNACSTFATVSHFWHRVCLCACCALFWNGWCRLVLFFCFEHPLCSPAVQLGHLLRMSLWKGNACRRMHTNMSHSNE